MPKTVKDLRTDIEACKNKTCIDTAIAAFEQDTGKKGKQEGGKVFSDSAGGQIFVTTGGKVFG